MEWKKVQTQADIDQLLDRYDWFHDACICSMQYVSGAAVDQMGRMCGINPNCSLVVQFESQWPALHQQHGKKRLELKFTGLRRCNLIGYQNNYFCNIYACYLAFEQGYIIWSEDDSFDPNHYREEHLFQEPMASFVVADGLEWRM